MGADELTRAVVKERDRILGDLHKCQYNLDVVFRELETAQADNEALRGQVNRYAVDAGNWRAEAAALESKRDAAQAENTRLREANWSGTVSLDEAIRERDRLTNQITDLRYVIPSLVSFAIAPPSNEASCKARDSAVEQARKLVPLLARFSPNEETPVNNFAENVEGYDGEQQDS